MTSSAREDAQLVHEPWRQIPSFDTYLLPDGRWRAVHKTDKDRVLEDADWQELFLNCVAVRVRLEMDKARDELMARHLEARDADGRTALSGPGGGLSV